MASSAVSRFVGSATNSFRIYNRRLVVWVHKPHLPTGLGMQPRPLPLPHQVLCLVRDLVPLWADNLVLPLHDSSQHDKLLAVPEWGKSH